MHYHLTSTILPMLWMCAFSKLIGLSSSTLEWIHYIKSVIVTVVYKQLSGYTCIVKDPPRSIVPNAEPSVLNLRIIVEVNLYQADRPFSKTRTT